MFELSGDQFVPLNGHSKDACVCERFVISVLGFAAD